MLSGLATQTSTTFKLGTKTCTANYRANENAVATLLSLHDNENTAVLAFENLPTEIKFNLFEMQQANERLFQYQEDGKDYLFDPNRIFSDGGIKNTLKPYNAKVASKIKDFAFAFLKKYRLKNPDKYLISIHNNTNEGALCIQDISSQINTIRKQEMFLALLKWM